jgi:hypothetical protein
LRLHATNFDIYRVNSLKPEQTLQEFYSFIQTYSFKAGIKQFGKRGEEAAMSEVKQLHDRITFELIDPSNLKNKELEVAMESLIFPC